MLREGRLCWAGRQGRAGLGVEYESCAHTRGGFGAFVPADWGMGVTWGNLSLALGPSRVTKGFSPLELIAPALSKP